MKKGKITLYEAVATSKVPKYIIIGALSKAGLLAQYRKEEKEHGIIVIEPTITTREFDKIIKDFKGE